MRKIKRQKRRVWQDGRKIMPDRGIRRVAHRPSRLPCLLASPKVAYHAQALPGARNVSVVPAQGVTMTLHGQVAIVTGGSRGIGRAICCGLAAQGAKVVVASRTEVDTSAGTEFA